VLVLGVYHFVSTNNEFTQRPDDVLAPRRQREIQAVVDALARFRPTKIVVEAPVGDSATAARYAAYRRTGEGLDTSEVEQLGFRLARRMGHERVYPVDVRTEFDLAPVRRAAATQGQAGLVDSALAPGGRLMAELSARMTRESVGELLRFHNSARARATHDLVYLRLARVGGPEGEGATLVARWYERNLRIFANVARLVESPEERVLVIYGQGHAPLLREFVQGSPDLALVEPSSFLPR
jgi:hypothetical protein